MTDCLHAPVLTSAKPEQIASVEAFMNRLRKDNAFAAKLEIKRLAHYLKALGEQLKHDVAAAKDQSATPHLKQLSKPRILSSIFSAVACHTRNTILSEIVLGPENMLYKLNYKNTQFAGKNMYGRASLTLGFVQVFRGDQKSSVSFPVFAFDSNMMGHLEAFRPERLLQAFQAVMTAGNHDMLHHYSNRFLNDQISRTMNKHSPTVAQSAIQAWSNKYFSYGEGGDTYPKSYESWLMLEHARVRRRLGQGQDGRALQKACDRFFDELERISGEMAGAGVSREIAHQAIDYFGTMLCFAMMRFLPLNDPLLQGAVRRLQKADPDPGAIEADKEKIIAKLDEDSGDYRLKKEIKYGQKAIANYRAAGVELLPENPDYASLKTLQLIGIAPWVAHLFSPPQAGSVLAEANERVGKIAWEMIDAAAISALVPAGDGMREVTLANGKKLEMHCMGGVLHREGGPALVEVDGEGKRTETWYEHGQRRYSIQTGAFGTRVEKWYKDDKLHRENGPASIESREGYVSEEWYDRGELCRRVTTTPGEKREEWFKNRRRHRADGPAYTREHPDGRKYEEWYLEGKKHRDKGPAETHCLPNGARVERFYVNDVFLEQKEVPAPPAPRRCKRKPSRA